MAKRNLPLGHAIPMEPGERDRKVVIQQATDGADAAGFPKPSWDTLATVYMRKLDLQAKERVSADQVAARGDTQWEMGYRPDMDPELVDVPKARRLSYQGRFYDITSASQIGRRDGIELVTIVSVG